MLGISSVFLTLRGPPCSRSTFMCGILNLNVKSCLSPCGSAIEWPLVQTERFHLKTAGTASGRRLVLPKFILVPSVKRHRGKIIPTIRHSVLCSTVLSFLFIYLFIYLSMSLFDRDNNTVKHSNYKLAANQMRIDFSANANANANSQLQYTVDAFPQRRNVCFVLN